MLPRVKKFCQNTIRTFFINNSAERFAGEYASVTTRHFKLTYSWHHVARRGTRDVSRGIAQRGSFRPGSMRFMEYTHFLMGRNVPGLLYG